MKLTDTMEALQSAFDVLCRNQSGSNMRADHMTHTQDYVAKKNENEGLVSKPLITVYAEE